MTDYPYDPELPFVLTTSGNLVGRFVTSKMANLIRGDYHGSSGEVIDTTPAPKIPADAEFIHWVASRQRQYYAKRYGHPGNKVWLLDSGRQEDEADLIDEIRDAEVVVLKRA